ncbi:MAG: glutamate racemase [Candidatus Omnitrophota bacterium]|nr:glutamate racemase [Candidatus Omnitrophota bacterium]
MKALRNRPIGIFDSGVGGLTVARSVHKRLPHEDIIYFGDTARVPYGNKSRATIKRFSRQIIDFMMGKKVKMIIVACNTASSLALPSLKDDYAVPVIGVIAPGIREAVRLSGNGRIGVIGTGATISSGSYERELKRIDKTCRLFSKSCPLFVPLVENRFTSDPVTYQVAERYLKGLRGKPIDTLILGCTHYPVLKTVIGKVMNNVRLVDSSSAVAGEVAETLLRKELEVRGKKRRGELTCFVSDDVKGFRKTAEIFMKKKKIRVKKVVL